SAAADTADPEERTRLMNRVRGEVEALNRIIDDFLTFARPLQTEPHGSDLRDAVRSAAELAENELIREGCELEVDVPREPLMAVADRDQVKRAVLNLLHNAAQVAGRVRVRAERSGTELLVRVTDDGPGVPEDLRERIFEPFITDKEKGAGLGLAIVRKVAEAHGGRVDVGDAEDAGFGSGAEFRLYLPGLEEPPTVPYREGFDAPPTERGGGESPVHPSGDS
ncbi:MAG TPA: HAMP domain-containing sensor histidine kinase, partial [Longimicrobiales bacterium]|nr:HAMP domain-containing sensor histidine kinase [Longimicrobiales bacterium]